MSAEPVVKLHSIEPTSHAAELPAVAPSVNGRHAQQLETLQGAAEPDETLTKMRAMPPPLRFVPDAPSAAELLGDVLKELQSIQRTLSRSESAILRARSAAQFAGVSPATWARLSSSGKVPRPVKLGGCIGWARLELSQWIAAGCPDRKTWESMKKR
jgi:predicted DNA-binding transcriptional regulator AlpA